jgi:hypothetical protein
MIEGITLQPNCFCTKCDGKGFLDALRCQTVMKDSVFNNFRQCSHPATYQVDGIPCCKIHYFKQYRDYKKGLENGTTN